MEAGAEERDGEHVPTGTSSSSALELTRAGEAGQDVAAIFILVCFFAGVVHTSREATDISHAELRLPRQPPDLGVQKWRRGQESLTSADQAAPTLRYFSRHRRPRRAKQTAESRFIPADATFNFGHQLAPRPHQEGDKLEEDESSVTEERQQLSNSSTVLPERVFGSRFPFFFFFPSDASSSLRGKRVVQ